MPDLTNYGFIGGGNMGEALIKGLIASGKAQQDHIWVHDVNPSRLVHLTREYHIQMSEDNVDLVRRCGIVVLAVKPQNMEKVLMEVGPSLSDQHLVISIAAGITLNKLQSAISASTPVIRTMPNTPALVMAGATALAPGAFVNEYHMALARDLFESVGLAVEVEEKYLDIVTGLSGSGPAYVFVLMEAMADGALRMGLPRAAAQLLAAQSVLGAAKLLLESGRHPGELKDMVTSPGGTAITGLHALEKGGFRGTIMDAIAAATNRSRELGSK
jgi:pyrroline-5-carboxylate reductase